MPTETWTTKKGTVISVKRMGVLWPGWRILVQRKDTEVVEYYGGKHPTKEAAILAARVNGDWLSSCLPPLWQPAGFTPGGGSSAGSFINRKRRLLLSGS